MSGDSEENAAGQAPPRNPFWVLRICNHRDPRAQHRAAVLSHGANMRFPRPERSGREVPQGETPRLGPHGEGRARTLLSSAFVPEPVLSGPHIGTCAGFLPGRKRPAAKQMRCGQRREVRTENSRCVRPHGGCHHSAGLARPRREQAGRTRIAQERDPPT